MQEVLGYGAVFPLSLVEQMTSALIGAFDTRIQFIYIGVEMV